MVCLKIYIEAIEIAHTHPTYAVSVTSENGEVQVRTNELSEGDIKTTLNYSARFPPGLKLIIKAIVPNGFNYSMEISSGRF